MKTIAILQPGYLPWLGFFDQLSRCDIFVLYDDVQFDKHGWRNRNKIKTASGEQWLTVPIYHSGLGKQLIKDVRINNSERWQRRHVKALQQNYSKAAFSNYINEFVELIASRKWEFLSDLDVALIHKIAAFLGIKTEIVMSSSLNIVGDRITRLINLIKRLNGNVFLEGSAGKGYIGNSSFVNAGIDVVYQEYSHPVYTQLYGSFIPYMSVVDLIFNEGPDSLEVLKNV